jgi:replicative DNA helicase
MSLLRKLADSVLETLKLRATTDQPLGVPTTLSPLDDYLDGGWNRQQLIYLVGDSGKGKSWLASWFMLQAARWIADNPGQRPLSANVQTADARHMGKAPLIVFWSLEMGEIPVITRLASQALTLCSHEDVPSRTLRRGLYEEVDPELWERGQRLLRDECGPNLFIEFKANSLAEMEVVMAELSQTYDILFLVIDYFRLISDVAADNMTSAQEERSSGLKSMAQQFDCAILSIFDINRMGQQQSRPSIFHMRGGVAAQYDADIVLTLGWHDDSIEDKSRLETVRVILDVAKNRNGPQGPVELLMNLSSGRVQLFHQREVTHDSSPIQRPDSDRRREHPRDASRDDPDLPIPGRDRQPQTSLESWMCTHDGPGV